MLLSFMLHQTKNERKKTQIKQSSSSDYIIRSDIRRRRRRRRSQDRRERYSTAENRRKTNYELWFKGASSKYLGWKSKCIDNWERWQTGWELIV